MVVEREERGPALEGIKGQRAKGNYKKLEQGLRKVGESTLY